MLANKLMSALSGGAEDKLYVDDVFSSYLYTGNDSTQTINNGIDLAGKGGLVWTKDRFTGNSNFLYDTARGFSKVLISDQAGGSFAASGFPTANTNGFSVTGAMVNGNNRLFASWTFRKAPKFFDVVTYTGNGDHQQVSHSLGVQPGLIIAKAINATSDWSVWHRGATGLDATAISGLSLNATNAPLYNGNMDGSQMRATSFRPSTFYDKYGYPPNANGVQYVAYLFAHDPSADGLIQCGSFTTDGGGNATVNLGWEPQYLMVKRSDSTGGWQVVDSMRGFVSGATVNTIDDALLYPNTSGVENTTNLARPTATGFENGVLIPSATYIYLAIRRPNKPPTTGTEVYNAIAPAGTGANTTISVGFNADAAIVRNRNTSDINWFLIPRLTGNNYLSPNLTAQEFTASSSIFQSNPWDAHNGFKIGDGSANATTNAGGGSYYINHFFKRAPGFFDVVCYTGTGVAHLEPHGLGVVPELTIIKRRSAQGTWCVYPKSLGVNGLLMESTGATAGYNFATYLNSSTATGLNLGGSGSDENTQNQIFVAYLFASLPGISKVGSYTGNGTTQTINCGFTTGARFILIKRTDSTGDWFVWDTARGIVSANDPHLSLNTTASEVTKDDSVDPANSGFIVNQVAATNINVTGGSYIFLAIS